MAVAPNSTQIVAPRVELVDPRTGLMSREWYRFFYNLYEISGAGEGIIPVSRGGTGTDVIPADGRLLIGNGAGYSVNPLSGSVGIGVLNAPGNITLVNNGVLSNIAGTGVSVSAATGNVTISNTGVLSIIAGTGVSVSSSTGDVTISSTGVTSIIAGAGISVSAGAGDVTVSNTGVLSFAAGTTGLTPSTATTGDVTLAGTLVVANGGTGATDAAGARANLSAAVLGANNDITSMTAVTGGIATPTFVQLNTTATETTAIGKLFWDSFNETLNIGMDYGVIQQVGQEVYARVENATGLTIPNGTVVGFAGVGAGNNLSVAPYLADGATPSLYILGVMTHALPNSGEVGYCTVFGHVSGIDTSAFAIGDVLYASPTVAGALTNVKPTAPANVIPVAAVLNVSATDGEIFVRPTIEQMQYYGVFKKTSSQTPTAVNTENLLTFDVTQIGNGVTIGTPASRIVVPESGLYQLNAPVQLTSGSSSAKNVWIWFKKNGVTIANSARLVTTNINNGYIPITLSEVVSLAANDYVEMAFAADDTNVTVSTVAATAFAPAAPAIVLSVTQVQQ